MTRSMMSRRRVLGLLGATATLPALAACGNSLDEDSGEQSGEVKIGLVVPQSGVYAALGTDLRQGWDLWLKENGGKLGSYSVKTVTSDEGETPQTGVPAVQRVLQSEQVDIVVGLVNSATALGAAPLMAEAKKTLVVINAGAADITGKARSPYVWRTSFQNAQVAAPAGTYLGKQAIPGGVFLIASDYAAGTEARSGFRTAYEAAGGKIVGEAKPPFGTTQDYQPFLAQIQRAKAGAVYAFFAGAEAVRFVQQYAQFGLKATTPLYGSGFLTEGGVLKGQGDAAVGVRTSLFYTDQLDNPANTKFVDAYQKAYKAAPTCYSVSAWDAAAVLDRALGKADGLDGDRVSEALGDVGTISDSPRGAWSFDGQSPRQEFYLRTVQPVDGQLRNVVSASLGQQSQV
ncbi:ABC transporter substrate-binding protein [Cryptosporangium aurantiacum]|uniref:Amino acid/amide ABC transporter substrate-binding protein, HAAT family n=1 Tax=Cryptosporangium aurantiacum TaxID=134849 RepID=A0A1M7R0H5_9ACTN|nr:ABC transporter substrate-binding protein [Cryptosporangium aurantiacum]SHN38216.1 amino acid/amide ABC transporter substrate-binding protein, HAAT family [Cryptosporangium aurantiacum]